MKKIFCDKCGEEISPMFQYNIMVQKDIRTVSDISIRGYELCERCWEEMRGWMGEGRGETYPNKSLKMYNFGEKL